MNYWDGYNGGQLQRSGDSNDPVNGKGIYVAIRDCNIFFENIDKVADMNQTERERWKAEVRFLRAYYHFWLVRQYGPIVISSKTIPVDATSEETKPYRNTLDECFDFISSELDSVINNPFLPDKIDNEAQELGRITRTIAYAEKAEVAITRASPLFNGNNYYLGLKDKRGIEIFNPVKTEEQKLERWREAANACKAAIDFAESIGHRLYYYTSLEYPAISQSTRTQLNIRMAMTDKWNSEVIWGDANCWIGHTGNRDLALQAMPRDLDPNKITNTQVRNNLAVPIKIAEQFYTKNGVPIDEDKEWGFDKRFDLRTASTDDRLLLKEGYTTAGLNFNREMRYYASLGFDGGIWFGQGKTDDTNCYDLEAKYGQNCGNIIYHSWNMTGIWPKKLVHFKTVIGTGSGYTSVDYPFPIIRLNSLYLWYPEALNEAGEADIDKIFQYVDYVRARAGLKGVKESWTNYSTHPDKINTLDGRRKIIQQERLIEFAFEGQRYWDLRRWMRAHSEIPKPITGWNIQMREAVDYYNVTPIYTPVFKISDYFTPIGESELRRNPNLVQNYGWNQ
ncbi:MAG: RagB/SusD family nutrient uptake outer membrane protein [Paludibacteraceae bacterium]